MIPSITKEEPTQLNRDSSCDNPRIIYLFIDGVGLGPNNQDTNPFSRYSLSYLSALGGRSPQISLPQGLYISETDAQLGVPGLPQSASGQTSLWTGVNGPQTLGHHKAGFPGPTLIRIIQEYSIVKRFVEQSCRATLLNAFSDQYLKRVEANQRLRSASFYTQHASGQPFLTLEDLETGKALYMDYTHEIMHQFFPSLRERFPVASPEQRGEDAVKMAQAYDLVLHEFFITDRAGHEQSWETAAWCIRTIEAFIGGVIKAMDPEKELLIVTSDHGNMEDLSVKTHTKNRVPTLAYGRYACLLPKKVERLTDIPAFIYECAGLNKP